jgi:large subunit ribosomal protein L28
MASKCEVCGKSPGFGNKVSFAGNHVKRERRPNIQTVNVIYNGKRVKMDVCTRCLKAGKVTKAAKSRRSGTSSSASS